MPIFDEPIPLKWNHELNLTINTTLSLDFIQGDGVDGDVHPLVHRQVHHLVHVVGHLLADILGDLLSYVLGDTSGTLGPSISRWTRDLTNKLHQI